jgi:hypothetical protein
LETFLLCMGHSGFWALVTSSWKIVIEYGTYWRREDVFGKRVRRNCARIVRGQVCPKPTHGVFCCV